MVDTLPRGSVVPPEPETRGGCRCSVEGKGWGGEVPARAGTGSPEGRVDGSRDPTDGETSGEEEKLSERVQVEVLDRDSRHR